MNGRSGPDQVHLESGMAEDLEEASCWNEIGVWSESTPTCPLLVEAVHCHNCEVFSRGGRNLLERPAPDGYLEEWEAALARDKDAAAAGFLSLFVFRIGGEWLALPMSTIEQVSEARAIRTIPHTGNSVLLGMVNIGGELQVAVALGELLGIDRTDSVTATDRLIYARLAVVQSGGTRWVIRADEVFGALRFDSAQLAAAPDTIARDRKAFTRGIATSPHGTVAVLDETHLFDALQRRAHV